MDFNEFKSYVEEGSLTTQQTWGYHAVKIPSPTKEGFVWATDPIGAAAHVIFGLNKLNDRLEIRPFVSINTIIYIEMKRLFPFLNTEIPYELRWMLPSISKEFSLYHFITHFSIRHRYLDRIQCVLQSTDLVL